MVTVTIKRADGSEYFKSYFNSLADAEKWIAEEKTRPYYQKEFTVEVDDKTAEAQAVDQAISDQVKAAEDRKKAIRQRLRDFDLSRINTLAELKLVLKEILDILKD